MFKRILLLAIIAAPLLAVPVSVSAVDLFDRQVCNEPSAANSAVCRDKNLRDSAGNEQNPVFGPQGVLSIIINLLSVVVGIVAVIIIVLAGLRFITSGSNPQDVANARERVIYALVALIIVAMAQVFVRFIVGRVI